MSSYFVADQRFQHSFSTFTVTQQHFRCTYLPLQLYLKAIKRLPWNPQTKFPITQSCENPEASCYC